MKSKRSNNRFLITVNVFRSPGPIRFVVNGEDDAERVIGTALKHYSKEGRLPILGSNINSFFLYPANDGFEALKPCEWIGSYGVRSFILCKKQGELQTIEPKSQPHLIDGKGSRWCVWFQLPKVY